MAIFTIIVHVCPSFCGQLSIFHVLATFYAHFVDTQDIRTLHNMSRCRVTKQGYTTYMLLRFANDLIGDMLKRTTKS